MTAPTIPDSLLETYIFGADLLDQSQTDYASNPTDAVAEAYVGVIILSACYEAIYAEPFAIDFYMYLIDSGILFQDDDT